MMTFKPLDKEFQDIVQQKKKSSKYQNEFAVEIPEQQEDPEDPIPAKKQAVVIQDYNKIDEPKFNQNLEISDQEIIRILNACEQQNEEYMMTQQVNTTTGSSIKQLIAKKSSPKIQEFNNCHISGNITINIVKK